MCLVLYYGFDACDSLEGIYFFFLLSQYLRVIQISRPQKDANYLSFTIPLQDQMLMNCALGLVHFHCDGMKKELKSSG